MQLYGSLGECNVKWPILSLFCRSQNAVTYAIVCELFTSEVLKKIAEPAILMEILQLLFINQAIR